MLLRQVTLLVLLVTCHGAPISEEERDQRSPELEEFGAQPADDSGGTISGDLPQQDDTLEAGGIGEGEEGEESVQEVPTEKILKAGIEEDKLEGEEEEEAGDGEEASVIEDQKADVKSTKEKVIPESEVAETNEVTNEDALSANDDLTAEQPEESEEAGPMDMDENLQMMEAEAENPWMMQQVLDTEKQHLPEIDWLAAPYYNLWNARRQRRSAKRPLALNAEDMHKGLPAEPGSGRVKRGAMYYPEDGYYEFTPELMEPQEGWDDEEPFADMEEEDLIKALKILHRIYKAELERQREEQALQEILEYEQMMDNMAEPDSMVYKRGVPMSMVPGTKRDVYDGWYQPGYQKRGYENYYPRQNTAAEDPWYTDYEDGPASWGQLLVEDRRNQNEYDRLMELADALGY